MALSISARSDNACKWPLSLSRLVFSARSCLSRPARLPAARRKHASCILANAGVVRVQDPYANYVLQSALTVSTGQLHLQLVDAIRPYLPTLRGTPHGKRILSKINVKL